MTDEERKEVIDTFISIGERFLKGSKHFHLEPILARDTIQAIKELQKKENEQLKEKLEHRNCVDCSNHGKQIEVLKLKAQIEKMKSFIHSEIDFCMYCPLTNECRNDEGTCSYAYATEEEQKNLLMDFIQKMRVKE